ncbi:S9 family peptidase [Muriicola sp. Z0-33]|uniref:S9 family peptidase n=1 Tax=Muriicola sp. Z0-33 TaxID=2816957 RepID=UPI002237829E|nr:S9 family peptidase [Muriicola sp. Z0-33]MCW5517073.1 S9 family peptidase [Muriicola sp. Z0-33]
MKKIFRLLVLLVVMNYSHAQSLHEPSFEEIISLRSVSGAVISPNGKHVVYQSSVVDWEENRYDTELWLSKDGAPPFQITNNKKGSSNNPKWSPDGQWIAFRSDRGNKTQLYALRLAGGEAFQISNAEGSVSAYHWSPDSKKIAYLQAEDRSEKEKQREALYGGFAVEDQEYGLNELWLINFNPAKLNAMPLPNQLNDSLYKATLKPEKVIDSLTFSINNFLWSPDGHKMAIEHQPDPLRNSFFKADISLLTLESGAIKTLINNPSFDGLRAWSPDSKSILYGSSLADSTSNYYKNNKLFRIDIDGTNDRQLAQDFDENIYGLEWNSKGIFGVAWQKTIRPLVKIDPKSGKATIISEIPERIWGFSFSADGEQLAFTAANNEDLTEVYSTDVRMKQLKALTNASSQIKNWKYAKSEVISWKSEDGAEIEGVLHKPRDYSPAKKYPLLVIIHGGPTGISTPSAVPSYVYPVTQWVNKGALVLRPNYRGSAGYGEKFRSLNVKNLGVGDAWDVLSGVKYLEDRGMIDSEKIGAMGWSQGGYISAFLTTNSDKFSAISVGAGISNWMTYYVNTDIHPFTRQYLKATPWSDKEIYEKTSPMTNINKAVTPTLIQHGEFDKRVPTANAYELFQGLQDIGAPTKLIIYKGFGHGINKPKERLAATWHNWQWFGRYIWEEEIAIPEKE